SDGNGSHASTLKSPSYTKSVSWQHYQKSGKILQASQQKIWPGKSRPLSLSFIMLALTLKLSRPRP
ncbi:hypothetical protein, partial [Escherichia coli]|uniref:hypothetical protein n=1 Tax=Escherichia coli TaxID=562 RepID=UPI001A92C974